jgi:hypothetical protein
MRSRLGHHQATHEPEANGCCALGRPNEEEPQLNMRKSSGWIVKQPFGSMMCIMTCIKFSTHIISRSINN